MKKALCIILSSFILTSTLTSCQTGSIDSEELTKVVLNEVVHSIFYAPQYVAIENGYFEEEGLSITLDVGQGADKSMTALVTQNADIALLGTEAGIYVYNEGKENYPLAFAQLTQTAGNFLISRDNEQDFTWENLRGKTLIGGRNGGMPQLVLEYILANKNLVPNIDVEIIDNLQYTSTAGAFAAGTADYTVEFDPTAYNLEMENIGYVVSSLGEEIEKIPYTVYMSTPEFIEENPEIIQKFTNAIYKAQVFVSEHSAKEIAEIILPHFSENTVEELTDIVERYHKQNTWKENPIFDEDGFNLIQDIMEFGGELSSPVPFSDLVNNEFAENAVK